MFYEQLIIKIVAYRTSRSAKLTKFSDCYASFLIGTQVKMALIRATLKDTQDEENIFVLMEDLVDNQKKRFGSYFQVKVAYNDIYRLYRTCVRA